MSGQQAVKVTDTHDQDVDRVVRRAIGEELRRAREEKGWSRGQLAKRMPSGMSDRTLLSYEAGTRNLPVTRFVEQCQVLGVSSGGLLTVALQRAHIHLENLVLRVDLQALLDDHTVRFRPLHQWARNKLRRNADRVAEVSPTTVDELADFVGYDREDLANHLAQFVPDERPPADDAPEEEAVVHDLLQAATR